MIHLGRHKRAPADYDTAALVRATDGFSGAELEEAVVNATAGGTGTPLCRMGCPPARGDCPDC